MWDRDAGKNTLAAFERSFAAGFGVELDIRDYQGKLVVSHDVASDKAVDFVKFLKLYSQFNNLPLAVNIKADGLRPLCAQLFRDYKVKNYFLFDMSAPECLGFLKSKMNVFTRQSEFEGNPCFYAQAKGVWMDEFTKHWITPAMVGRHLKNRKKVCLVSPELHHRAYQRVWQEYKRMIQRRDTDQLMLCTDHPLEARRFFYG